MSTDKNKYKIAVPKYDSKPFYRHAYTTGEAKECIVCAISKNKKMSKSWVRLNYNFTVSLVPSLRKNKDKPSTIQLSLSFD